jgi:hypothetical protein
LKRRTRIAALALAFLAGPLGVASCGNLNLTGDWRTANRASAGIAPLAVRTPEAIVQVYAGRAFRWRGIFGVHTWIATKEEGAPHYVVHDVIGWRSYYGESSVASYASIPDRHWFGAKPELLAELRGPQAVAVIPRIYAAVRDYPHANDYVVWPGPNSNTFVAHVARQIPELRLDLPPTAIGKDYLANAELFSPSPSGTGVQISLVGALGVLVGVEEGLEFNVLGLTLGIDPLALGVKLPGIGNVGLR